MAGVKWSQGQQPTMCIVRVGIDLTAVGDVAQSLERFGDRYARTVYTDTELADCAGEPAVRSRGLAARFAAKEATLKALGVTSEKAPGWRQIEIRRTETGAPELVLHGLAAELAGEMGISSWAISLTHEGDMAAAVVIGTASS